MSVKQQKIFWPVLIVVALSLGAIALASGRKAAHLRRDSEPVASDTLQTTSVAIGPAQVVRFTLYDAGIFPREARASAGQVVICIEDVTGNSEGLVVQNEARVVQGQVVRSASQWRGARRMALLPGTYLVFDASRPGNRATLLVEP